MAQSLQNAHIVMKDISRLAENTEGIHLMDYSNPTNIKVMIEGQEGPYKSGKFKIRLQLPFNFPYSAPEVIFTTKMYHPNISVKGRVCMDRLDTAWKPTIPLKHVCKMVQCLLNEPNPNSPLNVDAARMFTDDFELYERTVLLWVKTHAHGCHTYEPFEERLSLLTSMCGDESQALRLLTQTHWNLQAAQDFLL